MTPIPVAIIVKPHVDEGKRTFEAWAATSVVDGLPVADEGYRFGHIKGNSLKEASDNLRDHLEGFPCEFKYVHIKQLQTINLRFNQVHETETFH